MKKWLWFVLLLALCAQALPARAQGEISFGNVVVQFWPEYDRAESMLVIYDFILAEEVALPVEIALRFPLDADIIAVAYEQNGDLLNVPVQELVAEGEWQILKMTVDTPTTYRVEYYAPIEMNGNERSYAYLWPGDYAVNQVVMRMQIPVDTIDVKTNPNMPNETREGDLSYRIWSQRDFKAGDQIPVTLQYTKTSDRLTVSAQPAQPGAVSEDASGRISLQNFLPYLLGGLGFVLIVVGGYYFWQSGRGKSVSRRRYRPRAVKEEAGENVYCHQCGKRAQPSDRFCRTCGTRLRKDT